MPKNISKIYKRSAFLILAVIISGLLNICSFAFQARAIQSIPPPQLNFTYGNSDGNSGNCLTESMPEPAQTINYPAVPLPECCLTQNRNFNALINTANDNSAPVFTGPTILSTNNSKPKNNYSYHTSRLAYPPPSALAIASTVIRE